MKYKNLPDLFFKRAEKYSNKVLMKYKTRRGSDFKELTWIETRRTVEEIAAGLKKLGIETGDNVGLLSQTCHHWMPCDFAILSLGAVTVPFYHNATSESVTYIINHAEIEIIIVRDKIQLQKIRSMWSSLKTLKYAIVMVDLGDIPVNDPKILTLTEVMKIGREELLHDPTLIQRNIDQIDLKNVASIIYTSGTTGIPKGVVLSHKNFLIAALSFYQFVPLEDTYTFLSFLPLAHIFERVASEMYGIDQGVVFSYCERTEDLPAMLVDSHCDIINVVPRILEKLHDKILNEVSKQSPLKQKLFNGALDVGIEYAKKKIAKEHISWDLEVKYNAAKSLVLGKVKAKIAPNLRYFVVGGAPFSAEMVYFFAAFEFGVIEGYGLTETSAPISVNPPWANKPGTVGIPFKHFEVKISEDGEILCKGDSVFLEYYKDPKATAEAIINGWFHTGDLGEFDEDGYLKITGRKKDLIITAGGKNVAPTRVEEALLKSRYLTQAVVFGDKQKYLAALLVLNEHEINEWLKEQKINRTAGEPIEAMKEVYDFIQRQIEINLRTLDGFEQVKAFHLMDHEFTIDSGELTPTLKVKRNVVRDRYKDLIEPLFMKSKES